MTRRMRDSYAGVFAATGARIEVFEIWLDLMEQHGPMAPTGPLRHDLLLPAPGRDQIGLNVFEVEGHPVALYEGARRWASEFLGSDEAVTRLRALMPAGVRQTWGVMWRDGGYHLKAYFGERGELSELARALAIPWSGALVGLAVDVGAREWDRGRAYVLADERAPVEVGEVPDVKRRLLTLAADKTSLNLIFGPAATLADLREAAARAPGSSCLRGEVLASLPAHARPVAYEIDCTARGITTDALVTLGAPRSAEARSAGPGRGRRGLAHEGARLDSAPASGGARRETSWLAGRLSELSAPGSWLLFEEGA